MAFVFSGINFLNRKYPLLLLLCALIAGIVLQQNFSAFPTLPWLLCAGIAFMIALLLHRIPSTGRRTATLRTLFIGLCFLFTGSALSCLRDIRQQRNWYGHYLDGTEGLFVKVTGAPQQKAKTWYLPATVMCVETAGQWIRTEGQVRLYIYRKDPMPEYAAGQTLLIPAKLLSLRASGNPFAFDYAAYSARNGIFHQAFLSPEEVKIVGRDKIAADPLLRLHQALASSISRNVPDSNTRSLLLATLLNERAGMDDVLWDAYTATGIVHIIAISGMHIVLLAGMLLFVLKLLPHKRLDRLKYLLALLCIWLYIALTGFPPSAVRAAVMFSIATVGLMTGRQGNPINTWAASGLLLLCYNPYWLYDIGIQLSFFAVLSIMLFYQPVRKWIRPGNRLVAAIWDMLALSIAAQILVSPLLIYYFHQFPLLGLVASVPAAIFSTVLMYGAILLFCLHFTGCGGLSLWLGKGITLFTQGFHAVILFLARYTPTTARRLFIDRYEFWLLVWVILFACLFFMKKRTSYAWAGLITALVLVADLMIKDIAASRQERLVVYNTSRYALADIFYGKTVTPVYPAPTNDKNEQYILLPSRLGFRAITTASLSGRSNVYIIGKARILFLDSCTAIATQQDFPIDFLVISNTCTFLPQAWCTVFHPRKIIIDGSLPRWKAKQWQQQLRAYGASVHWVQEDGAWIYPQ